MSDAAAALRALLTKAEAALNAGEAIDAERSAKAVTALVRAERELAEFEAAAEAHNAETNEETLRAELRRRLDAFVEADIEGDPDAVLEQIACGTRPQ